MNKKKKSEYDSSPRKERLNCEPDDNISRAVEELFSPYWAHRFMAGKWPRG